ncbi:MAG: hypothetical protein QM680_02710 [Luteolibacter sp.]
MKFLYLLALFQLVAGPLVLLQVAALSKLVIREIPRSGFVAAAEKAVRGKEFHAVFQTADSVKSPVSSPDSKDSKDSKAKLEKQKMPLQAWFVAEVKLDALFSLQPCGDWARNWTPLLGQPPPGPPPRVG